MRLVPATQRTAPTQSAAGGDFRIIIDTREQEPYTFSCATLRQKLDAGDYSVEGYASLVAVERKSLSDFVHTTIHAFPRFTIELNHLARLKAACVVVEADLDAVLRGQHAAVLRGAAPKSVLGWALHISVAHRVPVYFCGSRQSACAFTEGFLRTFVQHYTNELRGSAA